MTNKHNSGGQPYRERESTEPHPQTGNINTRNNNTDMEEPSTRNTDMEGANSTGMGDSGWNDKKLTKHTQNHSSDA